MTTSSTILILAFLSTVAAIQGSTPSKVSWYQTSKSTSDRLTQKDDLHFTEAAFSSSSSTCTIKITPDEQHQEILGFGGALTQSSASVYNQLSPAAKEKVIDSYYGEGGINYNMGRVPIHSCDFSPFSYTFDETAGDSELLDFDSGIKVDQNLSLPLIHDVVSKYQEHNNGEDIKLFGSPWSPPAWMKDNNNMLGGGKLLDEYRESWALYFDKWITSYKNFKIPIWGVTVQNEPEASQSWESCIYTPETTRDFVADFLGPQLKKEHDDVLIFGFDHNKDHLEEWADTLLSPDSKSSEFMAGMAFHWYSGSCFENVERATSKHQDKLFLPSEACYELTFMNDDEQTDAEWIKNGSWRKGEGYGYDIMGDLNAGSNGWIDWNILLDFEGGPNHVGNYCDAGMIADEDFSEVNFHPQYYYIGQFSKFLAEGSKRVGLKVSAADGETVGESQCGWPYGGCDESTLSSTAFKLPDREAYVVVVMNCGDDEKTMDIEIEGVVGRLGNAVGGNSIQTYIIEM